MKAVVYRGPGKVTCEDVEMPSLTPDGLLLKVTACGICGSDLRTYRHGMRLDLDYQILGHEISGVVHEVGPQVSAYQPGDRLAIAADVSCGQCYYCKKGYYNLCENWRLIGTHLPGGMAEYMLLTHEMLTHGIVHRIPDTLADLPSALAEPSSSVIWAQQMLSIEPGEVVVIFGDGPIGALHVQVAQARGAKPILIGRTGERLEMFKNRPLGAWHVFNNDTQDVIAEVRKLTDGRGADAAIVAAPAKSAQAQAVHIVRKRGRVALFGGLPKHDPLVELDTNRVHYEEITVVGTFSYHPDVHAVALDLLDRRLIKADEIITATYPLQDAAAAFQDALNSTALKVVFTNI